MIIYRIALVLLVLFPLAGEGFADELQSGLEIDDFPGAFYVLDITGPNRGRSLCYRCAYGDKPVVAVFTREMNSDVIALIKDLDEMVVKNRPKKLSAFVVLLSDDPVGSEKLLRTVAKENKIKQIPLTTYDDSEGPPEYNISQSASVNVMMWVKSRVKVSRAFSEAKLVAKTRKSLLAETDGILVPAEKRMGDEPQ